MKENRMNIQARLHYASAGVSVIRTLMRTERTMRYNEFARAIGLMAHDEPWQAWHRRQVTEILQLVAAVELMAGVGVLEPGLDYRVIVNADGEPGTGVNNDSRIVTTRP